MTPGGMHIGSHVSWEIKANHFEGVIIRPFEKDVFIIRSTNENIMGKGSLHVVHVSHLKPSTDCAYDV